MEIKANIGQNVAYVFFDENKKAEKIRKFCYDKTGHLDTKKEFVLGNTASLSEIKSYIYNFFVEPVMNSIQNVIKFSIYKNNVVFKFDKQLTKENLEHLELVVKTLESNFKIAEEAVIAKRQPIFKTKDVLLENGEEIYFLSQEVYLNNYKIIRREKDIPTSEGTGKIDKYSRFYLRTHRLDLQKRELFYLMMKILFLK